jgi:DNA (cytosine-5)-methyltransferase 1
MTVDEVGRRIEALRRDFTILEQNRGGRTSYQLGEWRAFRGQEDHDRHLAFAQSKTRAKVS